MLKNLGYMLLGATLLAATGYGVYYFGDYVLLSSTDQAEIIAAIMADIQAAMQHGYELCKNGF